MRTGRIARRRDRPDRTRRHAELAGHARVVVDRPVVFGGFRPDEDRPQQDEVAELGVDDVAMNPHHAQAGGDCHGLVRDDPHLLRPAVGLHREAHRRVDGRHALPLQGGHDGPADLVHVLAGVVELQVRHRPGRVADRLPIHPADHGEQRPRPGVELQDVGPLVVQARMPDLDQPGVVGPAIQGKLPQP